jgi:hypothetical protein
MMTACVERAAGGEMKQTPNVRPLEFHPIHEDGVHAL